MQEEILKLTKYDRDHTKYLELEEKITREGIRRMNESLQTKGSKIRIVFIKDVGFF